MSISKTFFNPTALIEEIKKRPCLYENPGARSNAEGRLAAWGEIGAALIKTWFQLCPPEKDAIVRDMQTKWKSFRDNYSRQIRIQEKIKSGELANTGKKYVYMDHLQFLEKYVQRKEKPQPHSDDSKSSTDTDSVHQNEDNKSLIPLAMSSTATANGDTQLTHQRYIPIQPKPSQLKRHFTDITVNNNVMDLDESSSSLETPPLKKVVKVLEDFVNLQKDEWADDPLGNRKFLNSLLPFMRRLPDDVNLEVRLQLLSVLQSYSSGRYSANNEK